MKSMLLAAAAAMALSTGAAFAQTANPSDLTIFGFRPVAPAVALPPAGPGHLTVFGFSSPIPTSDMPFYAARPATVPAG